MSYGKELILDIHSADPARFTRRSIGGYFAEVCKIMEMKKCEVYFWDDVGVPAGKRQTNPKTKGTTAVQFILTSNITVHTLELLRKVFVNVFSCKEFDERHVAEFTREWFLGEIVRQTVVERI